MVKTTVNIQFGQFYRFESENDKRFWLACAQALTACSYQDGNIDFDEFMDKDLLRISPHGHHINYRTRYCPSYHVNVKLFKPEEEQNMANYQDSCYSAKPATTYSNPLIEKYVYEDQKKIIAVYDEKINDVLAKDRVVECYTLLKNVVELNNEGVKFKGLYDIVSKDQLTKDTKKQLEVINQDKDAEIKALRDKAFECDVLLQSAQGNKEVQSILRQYGFLRKANKEVKK